MPTLFLLALLTSARITTRDNDSIADNQEDDMLDMAPVPENIRFEIEDDDVRDILAAKERAMATLRKFG